MKKYKSMSRECFSNSHRCVIWTFEFNHSPIAPQPHSPIARKRLELDGRKRRDAQHLNGPNLKLYGSLLLLIYTYIMILDFNAANSKINQYFTSQCYVLLHD